jgi:hypothetical protein
MTGYRGAGVYVFRTRRPGVLGTMPAGLMPAAVLIGGFTSWVLGYAWWVALLGLLFCSRHTAYVGESTAVRLRKRAHLEGSVKWNAPAKPWSDLEPSWYFIPLPGAPKFVLRAVETLLIALLWPVYNHAKNLWNPRRIPLSAAKRQRNHRDLLHWSFNCRIGHVVLWVSLISIAYMNGVFA